MAAKPVKASPEAELSGPEGSKSPASERSRQSELPVSHPTPPPRPGNGPMHGLRVVEIAHPFCAFAGRLMADAGADVVLIEPPDGAEQRFHGPFANDEPHREMSLSWWAENAGKRSVVCDLETGPGRRFFRQLVATADVLLEAERPGHLEDLGLDYPDLTGRSIHGSSPATSGGSRTASSDPSPINRELVHVSITPFGREEAGGGEDMTDLTILARGGPLWSSGYDDHSLPPTRGRGNQGLRIAAHFAVLSTLTALLARSRHGGQFVDVSMVAAANVTTEYATYTWLAAQETVQRQTGRHATARQTESTQAHCADGRYLNTGVPPRTPREFEALAAWMEELGLADDFPLYSLLAMGSEFEFLSMEMLQEDPLAGEIFQAGREAMHFIASKLPAHDAFVGFQQRGIAAGVVWSPDEVMADPHFVERGFQTEVRHRRLGRSVLYPGPPIRFTESPMAIAGPAPELGEHTNEIQSQLD